MKYLMILFLSIIMVSCSSQVQPTVKYIEPIKTIPQELGQRVFECDSTLTILEIRIVQLQDSLKLYQLKNDTLKTQLFLSNYKIEKVRFYLNICLKKPSNDKFLKGWIRRAIN